MQTKNFKNLDKTVKSYFPYYRAKRIGKAFKLQKTISIMRCKGLKNLSKGKMMRRKGQIKSGGRESEKRGITYVSRGYTKNYLYTFILYSTGRVNLGILIVTMLTVKWSNNQLFKKWHTCQHQLSQPLAKGLTIWVPRTYQIFFDTPNHT